METKKKFGLLEQVAESGLSSITLRYDNSASCDLPSSFKKTPKLEYASA